MPRDDSMPPGSGAAEGARGPFGAADARALVQRGLAFHRQGDLERADRLYAQALTLETSADALHLRGLIMHQSGRHEDGERLIRQAIEHGPASAAFFNNLGETLRAQGRLEAAIAEYRRALTLEPELTDACGNIALAFMEAGRLEEALAYAERACSESQGAFEPQMVRGESLRRLSRFEEAFAAFRAALRVRPELVAAWVNAGLCLLMLNREHEAREHFERALSLDPRSPQAATGLGLALIALRELDAAERSLAAALEAAPHYPDALVAVARLRRAQHRHEEAVELARRALRHDSKAHGARSVMGSALKSLGRFPEAVSEYERAAAENPLDFEPLCALAQLRDRASGTSMLVERLESLLERSEYGPLERAEMHLAVAALLDEEARYDEAFPYLQRGNRLIRDSFAFDIGEFRELVDAIVGNVDARFLQARGDFEHGSKVPIFIFGMPRSGTTLTEQFLSMHASVFGAGEVGLARVMPVPEADFVHWLQRVDARQAREVAESYLAKLCADAGDAQRITDKMPGNFLYVGLIALLFPEAPLLHCARDPVDTCLSIYMQHFSQAAGHPYAYDLSELGLYYREYCRLMRHWRRLLGTRIHEVRYERLVEAPESVVRVMLDRCGLEWDPRCLRHTENTRPVSTLSAWQARQPLYTSSVGRGHRYESCLGELLQALGDGAGASAGTRVDGRHPEVHASSARIEAGAASSAARDTR